MTDISLREMAQVLTAIDTRTVEIDRKLDQVIANIRGLNSMTARLPDGRTLINVIGTILNDVEQLVH